MVKIDENKGDGTKFEEHVGFPREVKSSKGAEEVISVELTLLLLYTQTPPSSLPQFF